MLGHGLTKKCSFWRKPQVMSAPPQAAPQRKVGMDQGHETPHFCFSRKQNAHADALLLFLHKVVRKINTFPR